MDNFNYLINSKTIIILMVYLNIIRYKKNKIILLNGDWGLGPIPNPQSPNPNNNNY